ncbi:MAG: hypothetical protein AAGK17_02710 [Pseudomonadota bacterium]
MQEHTNMRADKTETNAKASNKPLGLKITIVGLGTSAVAACAPAPAPIVPPPPPPPVVETVPVRPLPPSGAAYVMNIPQVSPAGQRMTVNTGISDDERVWHFRSGWNVAALNCTSAQFDPITDGYSLYIQKYARPLKAINDRIDAVYRSQEGSRRAAIRARESKLTGVYNYFALPPARAQFCQDTLDISNRFLAASDVDPAVFAMTNFDQLDRAFATFFNDYAAYQQSSAEWDAKYGAEYGPSQPGWVAVQDARARGIYVPSVGTGAADPASTLSTPTEVTGLVADPQTGTEVPVIPTDTQFVSQPVTQPIPTEDDGDQ